ncbi:MAG: signal recognition particle-docking protein FtsY [bacterium]|nr:signal recognition particle-docking protein FtsY [bacterium]
MFDFFKKIINKDEKPQENSSPEISSNETSDENLQETIEKTGQSLVGNFLNIFNQAKKIDDDTLDEMEETLIKADLGVSTSAFIIDNLRDKKSSITEDNIRDFLKEQFMDILNQTTGSRLNLKDGLNIILITGVNGAGKTTLIGKLAYNFKNIGKRVLIAAGDTFRAAAEEQLDIWSKRAGADIVRNDGADPASVVFDAIKKAKNENYDILLIDTAGRLQNKFNLMEELRKIKRVIDKEADGLLSESMLVIDATTGQNALQQAKVFSEAVDLTSVALTKLDGTSKGAIVVAIAKEMKLPVKLVGVGEKMEDIREFSPQEFIEELF